MSKRPYMPWTFRQEQCLIEHASLGAEGVQAALREQLGVERGLSSIRARAQLMGVSLLKRHVCPGCGRMVRDRDFCRDDLCRVCHYKRLSEKYGYTHEEVLKQVELVSAFEEKKARREYDRVRQRVCTARKKIMNEMHNTR